MRSSLSLFALLPLAAHAQEIVVTGQGLHDPLGDSAFSVTTIDANRVQATASGRLEDALRDVAGLTQFRRSDARSANPTSQGATLRGLGGNAAARALVLLDGVPQGDPFAGYVNWPLYLPERIGRVRVTRGGGSGAGGSGALAGTIELDSIGARDAPSLAASLAGGSRDAGEARLLASAPLGGGFALISGGYARGGGFTPVIPARQGPADGGARYAQGSLAARAVVPAGAGELQASFDLFDDRRTRGTDFSRNTTSGGDAALRFVGRRLSLTGYAQLRRFTSEFASVNASRTVATQTLDQYNTPATGLGLIGEWRPDLGEVELRLGGEWRHVSGETREGFAFQQGRATRLRRAGGRNDIIGGFAEATHARGPLTLTGGAGLDRWTIGDGHLRERPVATGAIVDTRFARRDGWQGTGRLGGAWALSPALALRGAAYIGWRLPTLNELYRPFRVGIESTAANAALSPERSRGVEAGIGWTAGAASASLTLFDNRLIDPIANVTLSSSPAAVLRERRNLRAIASRGVELDAYYAAGDWRGVVSAAWLDPEVRGGSAGPALDGLRPAGIARVSASATLGWRTVALTARYQGAQFDDDLNQRRLDDALTLDAIAELPIAQGFSLVARVENAANARVEAAISAAGVIERASPRSWWLELRYAGRR